MYAKRAEAGQTGPMNELKGRVTTSKVQQKLLLTIVPRLKNFNGSYINISPIFKRRRGDNSPMVTVNITGDERTE